MSMNAMDEIIPGLWVGNLPSALDVQKLKENKVFSILSAMRGRITVHETFIRHQILLDDTTDADIMSHFLPAITFIQTELDRGRGVLVHCQAGMSRSVTIVAAYLMYTRRLDPEAALELIRKARPNIDPNPGFLVQLEIFHRASYKISPRDKSTRMFYMERTVEEVMNGDGTLPETDMFAKFPRTPTESAPATPGGPRRRIRCKMCRHELATREHMLDHGQLGPATPASLTPAVSRRPSTNQAPSRHGSTSLPRSRLGSFANDSRARRPSLLGMGDGLSMSALETEEDDAEPQDGEATARPKVISPVRRASGGDAAHRPAVRPFPGLTRGLLDSLSMSSMSALDSALETEDADEDGEDLLTEIRVEGMQQTTLKSSPTVGDDINPAIQAAARLGRRMSDAVLGSPDELPKESAFITDVPPVASPLATSPPSGDPKVQTTQPAFFSPADLAAQLYANTKLQALRSPMAITPLQNASPPILANPKCSGYFVEPMKWMEPFLENGQLAGKIVCPNKKCGAKLGNYDWAGVCCGCKEWVTPGFCINRSKVDEVV